MVSESFWSSKKPALKWEGVPFLGKACGGIRMTDLYAALVTTGTQQVVFMDSGTGIFFRHYLMREVSNRGVTGDAVWCIRITVFIDCQWKVSRMC